jgi:hypothetical protein
MTSFLPTFPETSVSLGSLFIRHDLTKQSATIYLKAWFLWHVDTAQIAVANGVFHFVEPSGDLVGIRCNSIPREGDWEFVGPVRPGTVIQPKPYPFEQTSEVIRYAEVVNQRRDFERESLARRINTSREDTGESATAPDLPTDNKNSVGESHE